MSLGKPRLSAFLSFFWHEVQITLYSLSSKRRLAQDINFLKTRLGDELFSRTVPIDISKRKGESSILMPGNDDASKLSVNH